MSDVTYNSLLINLLPTVDLCTKDGIRKIDKFSKLPLDVIENHFKNSINKVPFCVVSGCRFVTAVNSYRYCDKHKYEFCQTCICYQSSEVVSRRVYDHPHFKEMYLCYQCIHLFIHCGIANEHYLLHSHLKNVKVSNDETIVKNIKQE